MTRLADRRYVSVEDLVKVLPLTRNAIYKMVQRNEIPGAHKIGRRVVFLEADVVQWLDQRRIA